MSASGIGRPAAASAAILLSGICPAQDRPATELERAIAEIRHIDPDQMTEAEKEAKAGAIADAWDVILAAGDTGRARVKRELEAVRASGEEDVHFQLGAGELLWALGGLEEAATIGAIWEAMPLEERFNYVFYPAFGAAVTRDERALPMLLPLLGNSEGSVFLADHALTVEWPLTITFVWGAYGSKGLPVLTELLSKSEDPMVLQSAMTLLADVNHIEALGAIRSLTSHELEEVRGTAIRILGVIGHPDDFDTLVDYLDSDDDHIVFDAAYALWEFEDLRAVPHLIPLLQTAEDPVWHEVFAALTHLVTAEALHGIHAVAEGNAPEEKKAVCRDYLDTHLEMLELSWGEFAAQPAERQEELVTRLRAEHVEEILSETAEYPWGWELTREEMLAVLEGWREAGRMTDGANAWVTPRHIAAAAVPGDLPFLTEVRASLYRRLSDECLYETRALEQVMKRVGRSRFRQSVDTSGALRLPVRGERPDPEPVSEASLHQWLAGVRNEETRGRALAQAVDHGHGALQALLTSVAGEDGETAEAVLGLLADGYRQADAILPALYASAAAFEARQWPALQGAIADLLPCARRGQESGLQDLRRPLWARIRRASPELGARILNQAIRLGGRAFGTRIRLHDPIEELIQNATPDYEILFPFQAELAIDLLGYRGPEAAAAMPHLAELLEVRMDWTTKGVTAEDMRQLEFSTAGMPTNAPEPDFTLPLVPVLQAAAARSMVRIAPRDPAVIPAYAYRLAHGGTAVRMQSAVALRRFGAAGAGALAELLAALEDQEASVLREVIVTLGSLGPAAKEAILALERLTSHPSPPIVERARSALRQIRGR